MAHRIGSLHPTVPRFGPLCTALGLVLTHLVAGPAAGQKPSALERIEGFGVHRLEIGPMTVLYSTADVAGVDAGAREAAARKIASRFEDAASFFAEELGRDVRFTLALLGPRDWPRLGGGSHGIPWSSQPDRLVVVPVRLDMRFPLPPGRDSARARRIQDVISVHELGHVLAAGYLHPAGFRDPTPPVRWFDELVASYMGHAYMQAREPELADFVVDLAKDVIRRTEPRFTSLARLDRYYDAYLSSPEGANTLGWYQNVLNLRAAELYEDYGLDFFRRIAAELQWDRYELWTTESVLDALERIAPGTRYWAEELESSAPRRY